MELQTNFEGKVYEGKNQELLLKVKAIRGYTSNEWITFLQSVKLGTLDGAKGQGVKLNKVVITKIETDGVAKFKKGLKSFVVFNVDLLKIKGVEKQG